MKCHLLALVLSFIHTAYSAATAITIAVFSDAKLIADSIEDRQTVLFFPSLASDIRNFFG